MERRAHSGRRTPTDDLTSAGAETHTPGTSTNAPTPDTPLRLRVLGPVTVTGEGDPVASTRLTQPRQIGLLVYLALARPRGLQPRDTLIELLWPEHDTAHGRQALRNALHGVRHRLGEGVIHSAGDQLVGLNSRLVSCDALDLERGSSDADEGAEPFQGLHVSGAPDFDQWLTAERERLRRLLTRCPPVAPVGARTPPAAPHHPYSADAWVLHARGHYLFLRTVHGGPAEELFRARDCFERALDLDPTFAPAVAGLANFYAVAARRGAIQPFHEHFARAIELSERARELDPTLAVPHVHFGVKALYLDDDFARAGVEFEAAVRTDPSYAEGHRFYGVWLGLAGRHAEALRHMEQAVALEPDVPHFSSSLAAARLAVGDRDGAEKELRRTLRLDPAHGPARDRLITLLEEDGRYEEAVRERERPPAVPEAARYREALDRGVGAYEALVRRTLEAAAEALEERLLEEATATVADIFAPPVVRLVQLHLRLGDVKRARRWAREARARRPGLAWWLPPIPDETPRDATRSAPNQNPHDQGTRGPPE